ncbi:MAG: DUF4145 domain-containing protein [Fibrobacteria bacterium]|nr:DUF4145 domain-containing protein [Fibrobacteria bacterium]
MLSSWWDLAEWSFIHGNGPNKDLICSFCEHIGNYKVDYEYIKHKPNSKKELIYQVLMCNNCANVTMVLWSKPLHGHYPDAYDYRRVPWPINKFTPPEHWPDKIKSYWKQTHECLKNEHFDACIVMARSALQMAIRYAGCKGSNLWQEIELLGKSGKIPPLMIEWSHELRKSGNHSAHPSDDTVMANKKDANDIVYFLDFLLEYLFDLPKRIADFRNRI